MVTNTDFRKSSLENPFLKVVVPGPSGHWSYHTGQLVFCLKFRLLSVSKDLNQYYNVPNDY